MDANNENQYALPEFDSLDELVEFVETHDMADYLEAMPEVSCDVDIQRHTFLVAVDEDLMKKLAAAARARHISTETLIRSWLEEKVSQAA